MDDSGQFATKYRLYQIWKRPAGKLMAAGLAGFLVLSFLLGWQYYKYSRLLDEQLERGPFSDTLNLYASPETVEPGDRIDVKDFRDDLYRIGYRDQPSGRAGWFKLTGNSIEVYPRENPGFSSSSARIEFGNGRVKRVVSADGRALSGYQLAPQLLANISPSREKRRMIRYSEVPKPLVNAVLAVEDKRFFDHSGFDMLRLAKAAYVDVKEGGKVQGASTLTMQLARNLWLGSEKSWRRKMREAMIALHLEEKLSKEQIFELYSNEVYLGRQGTYSVHGFGQAAWQYFAKDVRQLTLPEAALLAGLIQRPAYLNPFRFPERAKERRNLVLRLMRDNGFITAAEYRSAVAAPLEVRAGASPMGEAPYYVDLLGAELQNRFAEHDAPLGSVFTTIDPDLQREAVAAIEAQMKKVDKLVAKRHKDGVLPEVALVALDPRTGEVKAMVGGRDYSRSQLNRALARRPVGSTFKPFVYAAALSSAVTGGGPLFTPASVVEDQPEQFQFGVEVYEPGNFHNASYGQLTLRRALALSANVVTVKVAEQVGYKRVADLARDAGLVTARGTPSVALGAYDATPLELAGAYTAFANGGVAVRPTLIAGAQDARGRDVYRHEPEATKVLDPRVAFLMTNLMEGVVNSGTAASVRGSGFYLPAAGKTGTARDGWFAGFTSELLTVVWVGFDDYRDLGLEGAKSALPIWTEFMKRASKLSRYAKAKPFRMPAGITSAEIDPETGQLASAGCFETRTEYFIAGSEPTTYCDLHSHMAATGVPAWPEQQGVMQGSVQAVPAVAR